MTTTIPATRQTTISGTALTLTADHTPTARRWNVTHGDHWIGTLTRVYHTPPRARSERVGWIPTTTGGRSRSPFDTRTGALTWLTRQEATP